MIGDVRRVRPRPGSSAEVARLLGIPVVLVVDAKSAAYSMAPLLSGFINFRPDIRIAGVIFNRVGSPHHYRMLQEVCEDLNVTCLGYLPKRRNWSRSHAIWGWISAVLRRRRAGHAGRLAGGTCGLGTAALDKSGFHCLRRLWRRSRYYQSRGSCISR